MAVKVVGADTPRVRILRRHMQAVSSLSDLRIVVVAAPKPVRAILYRMRRQSVVVDHFVPLHEKYIEDQQRWSKRSARAVALRVLDAAICWSGHAILVDSEQHADLLARETRRPRRAFHVYPPSTTLPPPTAPASPVDVVWIGAGARFHAIEQIRGAVASSGVSSTITTSIDPADAANLLAAAKVALGVFGSDSPKAHRVVPYKVLDAMALGVPVITLRTESTHPLADGCGVLLLDSVDELPGAIRDLLADRPLRQRMSDDGRRAYAERFGDEAQAARLTAIFASL